MGLADIFFNMLLPAGAGSDDTTVFVDPNAPKMSEQARQEILRQTNEAALNPLHEQDMASQPISPAPENPFTFWRLLTGGEPTPQKISNAMTPPGQTPPTVPSEAEMASQIAAKKEQGRLTPEPSKTPMVAKNLSEGVALGDLFYGSDGEGGGGGGKVSANPAPGSERIPVRAIQPAGGPQSILDQGAFQDPRLRAFLLQTGLNLMAGGFGSPVQQFAAAAGGGGEAVGRFNKLDQARQEANNETGLTQEKLEIARESSRTKRLREKNTAEEAVAGMHPQARAFYKQRLKSLNQEDILDDTSPTDRYAQIMKETKTIDLQARFSSGMMKADEFTDRDLDAAINNPQLEQQLFKAVRTSPTEAALLKRRIDTKRGMKNGPSGKN